MAVTKIADVVSRQGFSEYVIQRTTEVNKFVNSGIITVSPLFDDIAQKGGALIKLPFWNQPEGDSEVMSEDVAVSSSNFRANYDQACLHMRTKEWGRTDLQVQLAGSDPFTALGDYLANYWSTEINKIAIQSLNGAFSSGSSMSGSIYDISGLVSGSEYISDTAFVNTLNLLGDSAERDTLSIVMNSAVKNYLVKQELIEYVQSSTVSSELPFYMGHPVLVDDRLTVSNNIYNTFVCGNGALALGYGKPEIQDEAWREPSKHTEYLTSRRYFFVHPLGIKFTNASVTGVSPTNAELTTAANWSRVYDTKNIRILKLSHKIG
jgi:hypothetical protein